MSNSRSIKGAEINLSDLPLTARAKLAELDLELSEGDITQKGYDKKRALILEPFLSTKPVQSHSRQPTDSYNKHSSGKSNAKQHVSDGAEMKIKRIQKARHNERYCSDAHSEMVQQALAKHKTNRIPVLPHGLKRQSLLIYPKDVEDNSSDEDVMETTGDGRLVNRTDSSSDVSTSSPMPSPATIPKSSHGIDPRELNKFMKKPRSSFDTNTSNSSSGEDVLDGKVIQSTSSNVLKMQAENKFVPLTTKLADIMPQIIPGSRPTSQSLPPDVTNTQPSVSVPSLIFKRESQSSLTTDDDSENTLAVTKVSAKIQQLLNTLKKPKKKPLTEYFQDDQDDLETVIRDENAPTPGGNKCKPTHGEILAVAANSPHSLEAAIHRYGTANPKCPCFTEVNTNGKSAHTITYGKLLSTMRKVAYTLTAKRNISAGTRVALVFPNTEPGAYACTFFGCLLAGIIPVSVEIPLSAKTAGSQQLGFLLRSCGVTTALTSDLCMKGLPKTDKGEVLQLKGWPKLQWILTDAKHLHKPSGSWQPPAPSDANQLSYIEYKTTQNNSVVGIAHTRKFILNHCRSVVAALQYNAGDIMINLLDFKRGCGLVHGILASVYSGMHVYHIPYALMKRDPSQWLAILSKNGASLALTKSRDLHWTIAMHKDTSHLNLRTLRMLLVSDAANPWSVGSCEIFLQEFQSRGLRSDAVCPCAWSDEALTVSVRRPGTAGIKTTLSMNSLSYGVVETEVNNTTTSLMIQDTGSILPNCVTAVKNMFDSASLCRTDEIGEIIVSANSNATSTHSSFYGLGGISEKVFQCKITNDRDCENTSFVRTGLVGYVGPSGRVFVTGKYEGLMQIGGRSHSSDDVVATVLAVEPIRFVYRGRIAVFAIPVLKDDRLIVIVEQKPGATEEECFKWMSNVIQAVDGVHGLGVYCLSLLAPNGLPRTPLGGVHLSETRLKFLTGDLQPCNILMCPHQCVTNLPKPRQKHNDIGAASILQGQVVTGVRLAEAMGQKLTLADDDSEDTHTNESKRKQQYLSEILKWRSHSTPDHVLFSLINAKGNTGTQLNCLQLHKRAERTAQLLLSSGLTTGDYVALLFPAGLELIVATYGCFYAGCVPVPIRPPHPKAIAATIPTVKMVVDVSKAVAVLSTTQVIKVMKSKEAINAINNQTTTWPQIIDIEDHIRKKVKISYWPPTPEMLAYVDFSVSTSGTLMGVKMSHSSVIMLCKSMKLQCELYPSRTVSLCLDPYSGLGYALWCLSSVFAGHHSQLIPPYEVDTNPLVWLQAVSNHKIRDAFLTYTVMEACMRDLAQHVTQLKSRGLTLSNVRTCVIIAEERPRVQLVTNFTKLYRDLGLLPRAVSTAFGCRVNVAVCLQPGKLGRLSELVLSEEPMMGSSCPDPTTVYVDARSLRNDRVALVEKGSPKSICLMESGKILPGVKIAIADPDTLGHCGDARLGEVWVSSPHNSDNYFAVFGGDGDANRNDHFRAFLKTGDTDTAYARTGYLGFLRRTDLTSATGERHDALYIVGPLEETLEIRGMRYHPIDIENSVVRSSNRIVECAVFYSNNLLVVAVELQGAESSALDIIPLVTNVILEEHYLVAGVVAILDPSSIPVNSRGEKQRMHLRDSFLHDKMDPIYVAYNM